MYFKSSPIVELTYSPASTLLHVNHGFRAERQRGFLVDMESGDINPKDLTPRNNQPRFRRMERVCLYAQGTHNILLIHLPFIPSQNDPFIMPSLQYALHRGCEQAFQLEENEIAAKRIGEGEHRSILFYETAEGGAGVLRRLVEEPDALATIAAEALSRCHFALDGQDNNPDCKAACYECLMSFNNQYEAMQLDRRRILPYLLNISQSATYPRSNNRTWEEQLVWLHSLTDSRSDLERLFLDALAKNHLRLPDEAQKHIQAPNCYPDFFYDPNVCVFCDGSVHDEPNQIEKDRQIRSELIDLGYRVVVIRYDRDMIEQLSEYGDIFGKIK